MPEVTAPHFCSFAYRAVEVRHTRVNANIIPELEQRIHSVSPAMVDFAMGVVERARELGVTCMYDRMRIWSGESDIDAVWRPIDGEL